MDTCLELSSSFISLGDKFNLQAVNASIKAIFERDIKAYIIFKVWYLKKTDEWMNEIINTSFHFHTFTNRFQYENIKQSDITITDRKPAKIALTQFPICPCGNYICCALYYSVGFKMKESIPIVEFVCLDCVDGVTLDLEKYEEIYQHPRIAIYPQSFPDYSFLR